MAGIPGGMELLSDDDDGDFMCYNLGKDDNKLHEGNMTAQKITVAPTFVNKSVERSNSSDKLSTKQNGPLPMVAKKVPAARVGGRSAPIVGSVVVDDLRMAALKGNLEKVKELLESGLDVDTVMKSNWTCLMYACSCGHSEMVKFLLDKKANPNYKKDMFTPLLCVCSSRQENEEELLKCVQALIEYGAQTNIWDRHHVTPLMYCARENRLTVIREILSLKEDNNRQDNKGWTALFWAASNGHGQSVRVLLEGGLDPALMCKSGQTAADVAYAAKFEEIGEILERMCSQTEGKLNDADKENLERTWKRQRILQPEIDRKPTNEISRYGELEMFLSGLNLTDYIRVFHDHKITFYDLLLLTDEELEKMGVDKVGVRKNILEGIRNVHLKKWEKSSLPDLRKQKFISCPEAVAVMANISNHLHYIKSSIRYLRNQIQKTPRILELGQEAANVHKLIEESSGCLRNEKILFDELRFFKEYLEKIQDRSEFQPADLIVQTVEGGKQSAYRLSSAAILSVTLLFGFLLWKRPNLLSKVLVVPQRWPPWTWP